MMNFLEPDTMEFTEILDKFASASKTIDYGEYLNSSDRALSLLANWVKENRSRLNNDDMAVLQEIGGVLYKQALEKARNSLTS